MNPLEHAIDSSTGEFDATPPVTELTRYNFTGAKPSPSDPLPLGCLTADRSGEWIRYADHLAILNRKAPSNSIEELAEVTLDRIAEFFGKCVNQPEFCGFSVEESEDAFGSPVSLTLTACEMVGGEPLRKVAK